MTCAVREKYKKEWQIIGINDVWKCSECGTLHRGKQYCRQCCYIPPKGLIRHLFQKFKKLAGLPLSGKIYLK